MSSPLTGWPLLIQKAKDLAAQRSGVAPDIYATGFNKLVQSVINLKSQRNLPYLRGDQRVSSSGNYMPLDNQYVDNGAISLASAGVIMRGSAAPTLNSFGFAFTATTTQATIYWDGTNGSQVIVQKRADRSRQTIPPGNITITGLSSNTRYYLLPFWPPANACQIGWVPGTVGTPQICFTVTTDTDALIAQGFQEREPLSSGYMYFDTPVSGSGGGGGGGGGCVMTGTDIETLGDSPYSTHLHRQTDWWRIQAGPYSLNCTPNHPLYTSMGIRTEASKIRLGDHLTHRDGDLEVTLSEGFKKSCTKIEVLMEKVHLFYANGFLSHNNKMANP